MEITLGKKIGALRRDRGWTQDELAEKLGVSAQAVSKWENDVSCPDIMLLPVIAKLFGTTSDDLLSPEPHRETELVPEDKRKSLDELMLRVVVNSVDGDKVRINLPMPLVKMALEMGMGIPEISGNDALKSLDIEQILVMAEKGVIGKLLEVESAKGDIVEIVVE